MNKRKVEKKLKEETAKEKILSERGNLAYRLERVVYDYPASTKDELEVLSEMEEVDFERALAWLMSDKKMTVFEDKNGLYHPTMTRRSSDF